MRDVYARANELWWRRRVLPGAAAALVLVAAVAIPAVLRNDKNQRRVAAVTSPTTESPTTLAPVPPESTTTTIESAPTTTVGPQAPPTRAPAPRATTTTTTLVCRNSYDPACGPFRWDPDPGPNEPTAVQITYTPANPHVGDQVTFHITYANPDGPASSDQSSVAYGDGEGVGIAASQLAPPGGCKAPYGPWTPPPRAPDTVAFDSPGHAYKTAGTYTVKANGSKGIDSCIGPDNPYRDEKSGSATITVSP